MNIAEELYQNIQSLPESSIKEVWQFVEFLKFKQQITIERMPNNITVAAIEATERGEYEVVSLDDLKNQWSDM